jgi:hypothetical protein
MNDIGAEVGRMAGEAALIVKDRTGKAPDFSEQSVAVIEETLEEASRYFPDLPEDQARQLVQCFGCYLLEVARHQFGGSYLWHEQRDQPVLVVGEPKFHVAIITWDKVRARLRGDKADNVSFFFDGFAQRVRRAEPGLRALYV